MKIALTISNNLRTFFPTLLLCLSVGMASSASATVILQTDSDGILIGATGIVVDGLIYNVAFKDGTCEQVFGSCPGESTPFTFKTLATATLASHALSDFVFVDGVTGNFAGTSEKTFGCSSTLECSVFTPYLVSKVGNNRMKASAFDNRSSSADLPDDIRDSLFSKFLDYGVITDRVWADWTLADGSTPPESNVPEPSSIALLGAGVTLLGLRRRKSGN